MIKMASITPIFKKGNKLDTSNYRPVSLIPNINKIFEKAMCSRLSSSYTNLIVFIRNNLNLEMQTQPLMH